MRRMNPRQRVGLAVAAWLVGALTVAPAIAAVTSSGGPANRVGGPAAPLAISLEPGDTARVSLNTDGSQLLRTASDEAAVSPDGRWVAYRVSLVGTATASTGIMLADRAAGTTTRIFPATQQPSAGLFEKPLPSGAVEEPSVSADGSLVAFGLTNANQQPTIVLWTRGAGLSLPASGTLTGNVPGLSNLPYSALHHPRLSADGTVLAFQSDGYADFGHAVGGRLLRAGPGDRVRRGRERSDRLVHPRAARAAVRVARDLRRRIGGCVRLEPEPAGIGRGRLDVHPGRAAGDAGLAARSRIADHDARLRGRRPAGHRP